MAKAHVKATHTRGPWTAMCDHHSMNRRQRMALVATGGRMSIDCTDSGVTFAVDCANARLCAAGPELLAACKLALGAFERNDAIDWSVLEKAIAKAEGNERAAARG